MTNLASDIEDISSAIDIMLIYTNTIIILDFDVWVIIKGYSNRFDWAIKNKT